MDRMTHTFSVWGGATCRDFKTQLKPEFIYPLWRDVGMSNITHLVLSAISCVSGVCASLKLDSVLSGLPKYGMNVVKKLI